MNTQEKEERVCQSTQYFAIFPETLANKNVRSKLRNELNVAYHMEHIPVSYSLVNETTKQDSPKTVFLVTTSEDGATIGQYFYLEWSI